MSDMNIVVLPEPVGEDTPIREYPDPSADRHAAIAVSWYGRRATLEHAATSSVDESTPKPSVSFSSDLSSGVAVCA
jgi:hypothetical protein